MPRLGLQDSKGVTWLFHEFCAPVISRNMTNVSGSKTDSTGSKR